MKKYLVFAFLLAFLIPFYKVEAVFTTVPTSYNLSINLSADQNTVTYPATGTTSYQKEFCGPEEIFSYPISGYYGGTVVVAPYSLSSGTASVSGLSQTISTADMNKTAGRAGTPCDDGSRRIEGSVIDSGAAETFSITKSLDVSSLLNGSYSLSVNLCSSDGTCVPKTAPFSINNRPFTVTATPKANNVINTGG